MHGEAELGGDVSAWRGWGTYGYLSCKHTSHWHIIAAQAGRDYAARTWALC